MIEYIGDDKEEVAAALKTLILKCTEAKTYNLQCVFQAGDTKLDCMFYFKIHQEEKEND